MLNAMTEPLKSAIIAPGSSMVLDLTCNGADVPGGWLQLGMVAAFGGAILFIRRHFKI